MIKKVMLQVKVSEMEETDRMYGHETSERRRRRWTIQKVTSSFTKTDIENNEWWTVY